MTRQSTDLFTRRRLAARIGRLRRLWVALLVAVVVVASGWVVVGTRVLGVSSIHVRGERTVTAAQVRQVAAVPPGRPLARLDIGSIRRRVETIPRVESAQVERSWPRSVRITVRERVTVAVVTDNGISRALDRNGVLFEEVERQPSKHLPRVSITAKAGDRTDALVEVAHVVAVLDPSIARKVARVEVASMDSISFVMRDGDLVRWGSAAQAARKAVVLKSLLGLRARTYDVTAPDRPTTKS